MIATPPGMGGRTVVAWIVVGIGLVAPWAWLTVLDHVLRRKR